MTAPDFFSDPADDTTQDTPDAATGWLVLVIAVGVVACIVALVTLPAWWLW